MTSQFQYWSFDINPILPTNWQLDLLRIAEGFAVAYNMKAGSVTSREQSHDTEIPALTVDGNVIKQRLPWLYDLYRGHFRDMAESCVSQPVAVATQPLYGVNLNIQKGTSMRYEAHVDSNPLQGLLYVTTHSENDGGELVVSKDSEAWGIEQIQSDCVRIHPQSGKLVFFDARKHPHYVTALRSEDAVRVVAAMNFYTAASPEQDRPSDLNDHLFGQKA